MKRTTLDLWVGIFVVAGLAALASACAQGGEPEYLQYVRDISVAGLFF